MKNISDRHGPILSQINKNALNSYKTRRIIQNKKQKIKIIWNCTKWNQKFFLWSKIGSATVLNVIFTMRFAQLPTTNWLFLRSWKLLWVFLRANQIVCLLFQPINTTGSPRKSLPKKWDSFGSFGVVVCPNYGSAGSKGLNQNGQNRKKRNNFCKNGLTKIL